MKRLCLILSLNLPLGVFGQASLSDLTDSVLANNYGIRIERVSADQSTIRSGFGAAGELPSLGLNGIQQNSWSNTRQTFFSGDVREADNAANSSLNVGVRMDWTLFSGFRVQATRQLLRAQEKQGKSLLNLRIEEELYQLGMAYFEAQYLQRLIASTEESVEVSQQLLELAKQKLELGKGNRLQVLAAQNALHADSSLLMNQQFQLLSAKTRLNKLMALQPEHEVRLADSSKAYSIDALKVVQDKAQQQNLELTAARLDIESALASFRQAKSGYYPGIGFFAEYNFVQSRSQVGILASNQSLGPAVGLSLNYSLFDGNRVRREHQLAQLELKKSRLGLDRTQLDLQHAVFVGYQDYLLQKRLYRFEKESTLLAEENLELARKRQELGAITVFDFRQVQEEWTAAQAREAEALYRMKLTELSLMRLSGELLSYMNAH